MVKSNFVFILESDTEIKVEENIDNVITWYNSDNVKYGKWSVKTLLDFGRPLDDGFITQPNNVAVVPSNKGGTGKEKDKTTTYPEYYTAIHNQGTGALSANTNYEYTVTVVGASVGDNVIVQPNADFYTVIKTAGTGFLCWAYVSAKNTVKVIVRVTAYTAPDSKSRLIVSTVRTA